MAVKVAGVLVVVFVIFYILTAPVQAHEISLDLWHAIEWVGRLIATIAKGLRKFVNSFT